LEADVAQRSSVGKISDEQKDAGFAPLPGEKKLLNTFSQLA